KNHSVLKISNEDIWKKLAVVHHDLMSDSVTLSGLLIRYDLTSYSFPAAPVITELDAISDALIRRHK
ncbi:hypothetical protein ACJ72_08642, partial [Emergomyces africanus]